jgi:hypothetical protein
MPEERVVDQFEQNRPSGAEARRYFWGFCGTTEVVPFHGGFKLIH